MFMKRALLLAALVPAACDDKIPGLCKVDSDCPSPTICHPSGFCGVPRDASTPEDGGDAAMDASTAGANETDAAADAAFPDASPDAADGGSSDGSVPSLDAGAADTGSAPDAGSGDAGPAVCSIGQVSYNGGDLNPANRCKSCQPAVSTNAWTDVDSGTSCGSGLICTSGTCAANCWIDSAQYPSGATKYGNSCLVCQPNASTSAWTNVAEGMGCGTGKYCHGGACLEGCWIESAFYANGAGRPGYQCQKCQASTSTTTWVPLADGTDCTTPGVQQCSCGAGLAWNTVSTGTSSALFGVWGSSAKSVWAVGQAGITTRWNGTSWSSYPSVTSQDLYSVWGSGDRDVWAVGAEGVIVHWTGTAWSVVSSGVTTDLTAVWGSANTNVWAVGKQGVILHWEGSSWTSVSSGTMMDLTGVWGSGPHDVWAAGIYGTLLHWNGSSWSSSTSLTHLVLYSLWGTSATDYWIASGSNSQAGAYHWNGYSWVGTPMPSFPSGTGGNGTNLYAASGTGTSSDAWATGNLSGMGFVGGLFHWNGTSWSAIQPKGRWPWPDLNGIWATERDLWVVGAQGTALHANR